MILVILAAALVIALAMWACCSVSGDGNGR